MAGYNIATLPGTALRFASHLPVYFGAIMTVAYPLHRDEREAVATYLGTSAPVINFPASAYCTDRIVQMPDPPAFAWNGWSPGAASARGVIRAQRTDSGCQQWVFQANGPVRSSLLVVDSGKFHPLLFGDQTGWFYTLQAETAA